MSIACERFFNIIFLRTNRAFAANSFFFTNFAPATLPTRLSVERFREVSSPCLYIFFRDIEDYGWEGERTSP